MVSGFPLFLPRTYTWFSCRTSLCFAVLYLLTLCLTTLAAIIPYKFALLFHMFVLSDLIY
jgi:hypothetical protein